MKVLQYHELAANKRNSDAQYYPGIFYVDGIRTGKDIEKEIFFY